MASAISSATQSIASLLKQTHLDDHEEVLKATNVALKKSKSDIDAQHVKAVALLKLDRYDGAVEVLEGGGDGLKERASLERAYALYKVGRLEESAHIANKESSRGMKHVEAQAVCHSIVEEEQFH
jgi:signal recognition particle subunit SRP72